MDLRQALTAAKNAQKAGELKKAEQHYREAAAAAPGIAGIHYNLALVLIALGQREEAVKSYREAVRRRPDYLRALNNMGNLLCDLGRFSEAVSILRQVIAIDPAYSNAAATLLIALSKLVEAEPTNAATRVDFAAALGVSGRLDEAEAMYQSALAIDKDSVVARRGLAATVFAVAHRLQTQGELAKAVDTYRKALEFRPDFIEAHNNLGNALKEQGKLDEAIVVYRRALEFQPDFAEAHHNLAIAYREQGKQDQADAARRKAIQLSTATDVIRPALRKRLTSFSEKRPAVMVVSHERSGTHFLMNSLAACYEYVSAPRIDLDENDININYYSPITIRKTLLDLAARPVANIVKSHHAVEFFADELPRITQRYVVFYIHRDPVKVMLSFWRFIHQFEWLYGPKVADPCAFALAEPCGHMMRYQVRQLPNLISRWAAHVDGWLAAAKGQPRIVPVRYEELDTRFEETVASFADVLGRKAVAIVRPARDVNVIAGGPKDPTGLGVPPDTDALRVACEQSAGKVIAQLGYSK
jgi:tetratricopeptide (TPR) repeat protein